MHAKFIKNWYIKWKGWFFIILAVSNNWLRNGMLPTTRVLILVEISGIWNSYALGITDILNEKADFLLF